MALAADSAESGLAAKFMSALTQGWIHDLRDRKVSYWAEHLPVTLTQ